MLFFRSEEHLYNWARYDSSTEGGVISLSNLVKLFSGNYFKRRMDNDYFSNMKEYQKEMIEDLGKLENVNSFWKLTI